MSFLSGICTGLILSLFSMTASATEPGPPPQVERPKPAAVDASNLTEVVQVLVLANSVQLDNVALARNRQAEPRLLQFAQDAQRDHSWIQETLETLARRKAISLRLEDLTPTSQQVKKNVDLDFQTLQQKPEVDFRAAFLRLTVYQYRKILKLYEQVMLLNQDAELKAYTAVFQAMIVKNLGEVEELDRP